MPVKTERLEAAYTSRPQFRLKSTRLQKRRRVTLIAAFRCQEGVVLCADSQETVGGVRVTVNKIKPQDLGSYQLAIAGTGNGDLIDGFAYSLELDIATWKDDLDERAVYGHLNALVQDYHENQIALYPSDSADDKLNHFLVCIKPKNRPEVFLWELRGTAITRVGDHTLMGIGESIYRHELARLYRPLLSANQAVLLGVHLFSLAKATSNYVGGPIDIIFVGPNGAYAHQPNHVAEMETQVALFNSKIAALILACPDIAMAESAINEMLLDFQKSVKKLRVLWTKDLLVDWAARIFANPSHAPDPYPMLSRGAKATLSHADLVRASAKSPEIAELVGLKELSVAADEDETEK